MRSNVLTKSLTRYSNMSEELNINNLIRDTRQMLSDCRAFGREIEFVNEQTNSLIADYKKNPQNFGGEENPSVEDIIKFVFQKGWQARIKFEEMPKCIIEGPTNKVQAIIDKLKTLEDYCIEFDSDQDVRIFTEDDEEDEYSNLRIIRVGYEYAGGDHKWACYAFFLDNDGDEDGFDVSTLDPKDIDTIYNAIFK